MFPRFAIGCSEQETHGVVLVDSHVSYHVLRLLYTHLLDDRRIGFVSTPAMKHIAVLRESSSIEEGIEMLIFDAMAVNVSG